MVKKTAAAKKTAPVKSVERRPLKTAPTKPRAVEAAPPSIAAQATDQLDAAAAVEQTAQVNINLDQEAKTPVTLDAPHDEVTVIIPIAFQLAVKHDERYNYEAGTREMPRSHATHWYARAQGVRIYEKG